MVQVDKVLYNKTSWDKVEGWGRIVVNIYEDTSFETLLGGRERSIFVMVRENGQKWSDISLKVES
jgi:hypothetical protein